MWTVVDAILDGIGVTVFSPGAVMTDFGMGWDPDKMSAALHAWQKKGPTYDGHMPPEVIGKSIAACFGYPAGSYVDFMEVKPNKKFKRLVTDGEVRYKSSIDFEGAELTPSLIRNTIYPAVQTMDRYLPGISE